MFGHMDLHVSRSFCLSVVLTVSYDSVFSSFYESVAASSAAEFWLSMVLTVFYDTVLSSFY